MVVVIVFLLIVVIYALVGRQVVVECRVSEVDRILAPVAPLGGKVLMVIGLHCRRGKRGRGKERRKVLVQEQSPFCFLLVFFESISSKKEEIVLTFLARGVGHYEHVPPLLACLPYELAL